MYVTDGELCRILGIFSDGGWKVGRTVSRHILHCLGGQWRPGLGARWAFGEVLLCVGCEEVFWSKAPGTDPRARISAEVGDAEGISCGQFQSGLGLKPDEVMVESGES